MAEIKVLKISTGEGLPQEHSNSDNITFNKYTAALAGGFNVTNGVSIKNNITFNALTDTVAGIENQNLLDSAGNATITGAWSLGAGGHLNSTDGEATWPNSADASPLSGGHYWDGDTLFGFDGTKYIPIGGQGGFVGNLDKLMIADEVLAAGDAVYISANDNVSKANAATAATDKLIGFATAGVADLASVFVRVAGTISDVLTAATAGDRFYLSPTTAGGLVSSPPTGVGHRVIQTGFALNATDLCINIQFMGIRS